jgi:hypothetical protein
MTRIMGFQYLWVDSLCIVQDDMHDRKTQITHMGQIYANAFAILVAFEKASSQSAWFGRPWILQEASFLSRIIEIPPGITFESTLKDSSDFRIQGFLDNRDDPWTPLKPTLRSELRHSRTPEMKPSFQKIANAWEQTWGKAPSVDWPNTNNSTTNNDMFKFLFASDCVLSELQVSISKSLQMWW